MSTYSIRFKCNNCGYIFTRDLKKGVTATGRAGSCPECECNENTIANTGQKLGVFPIVPKHEKQNENKFELLLEDGKLILKQKGAEKC